MVSGKGKEKVTDGGGKGKRKLNGGDDDKTGRKRKNRGVLQFFDDAAYQVDEDDDSSDDSLFDVDDFLEDEFRSDLKVNNEPGKFPHLPFIPKEEEMSEEELEKMLEERYKPGAGFVTYSEDGYEHKKSIDKNIFVPSDKDPQIWKVKCMVGRERHSAFCLMQKYVDVECLGTKLQIISACAVDHVTGFIFIEAEKQNDIYEACKGLSTIYSSRVTAVPVNEISRMLSVRSKSSGISEGMWARVKSGKYKGDLAQVAFVNHVRKKATVKLIPRIDLKAMAEKFGGGVTGRRTAIPAQRLISSSELEEFRPLIQSRRDRDTNLMFEILDGMMLKDGYLYKKVSIDSLSFWGTLPTEDELLKFEPSNKDESIDVQWLSQLYGEKKKKEVEGVKKDKGDGKSKGSTSASMGSNFEVHDLVFFGRKDFGVVIGAEKDNTIKVIKEGSEGPSVVTVKQSELKTASFDKKLFSVLDQHSNTLSVNDSVLILDGPLKDKQGVVKKIYKGILFLCDETEQENNGYTCVKAQLCEKVNLSSNASKGKGSEAGPSGFADFPSSPKSPLSPSRPLQERDDKSNFKRDDNGTFSVGQLLRIRVGPLKGYLCRVLSVRRTDVTVKLDSQQKILTVKCENLSEVRGRNSAISQGEEPVSTKPFDFLGVDDGARDWMDGAALSTEVSAWNAGGSTERTSWSTLPTSNSADDDAKKGAEDSSWQIKPTADQSSSWGAASANSKIVSETGSLGGWGKPVVPEQDRSGETVKDDSWGKAAEKWSTGGDTSGSKAAWGQSGVSSVGDLDQPNGSQWGSASNTEKDGGSPSFSKWAVGTGSLDSETGAWGNAGGASSKGDAETGGWAKAADKRDSQTKSWGTEKAGEDAPNHGQADSWNKPKAVTDGGSSWTKQDDKPAWGKTEGTSSWSRQDEGSSWKKPDGGASWGKSADKSSWGQQSDSNAEDTKSKGWSENKDDMNQESSWGRSKPFDGGRGSGGRRGRGGPRGGGGDNYGRGRSFDQGQSTSWNKEGQYGGGNDAGKTSSWASDQAGGWGKSTTNEGSKGNDVWDKANVSSKDENKDGERGGGWGSSANPSCDDSTSSGWNVPKDSNFNNSKGWGSSSNANEVAGEAGNAHGSWDKEIKPSENKKSSWKTADTSSDGNQSSDWSTKGNWGSQKSSEENSGSWKDEKNAGGGSSTGWGQSNWSKNGAGETGGNRDSTGSNKSNWNSGNGFGEGDNQDNGNSDRGRGGNWRGGRGGRGDRGGFRGRGGSDRGGFGGRGGGFGRGGFGGGGSDGGGFGGRGGSDRDGFCGRGGFRGRGRGDWNNREDDSAVDKSSSWGKGSNNDGEGWKSSGSWSQRNSDNNQQQSWNQPKGDSSNVSTGWGKPSAEKESGGGGGWGSSKSDWGQGTASVNANKSVSPIASHEVDTWGKAAAAGDGNSSGGWKKAEATDGGQTTKDEGPSDAWGKAAASSWGSGGGGSGGGGGGW
ncbi:hypothetical protein ABFS83_06G186000 [Erythranthe nasuta]